MTTKENNLKNIILDEHKSKDQIIDELNILKMKLEKYENISDKNILNRFSELALNLGDWIWEVDENMKFTYCSENVINILGYEVDEMIGKTPFDIILKDDIEKTIKITKKSFENKSVLKDFVSRYEKKTGEIISLSTTGVPIINPEGNIKGYTGVGKDITSKIESENKIIRSEIHFRTLMEQSPISTQVYDKNGYMIKANKAWAKLWDVKEIDIAYGKFNIISDPQVIEMGLSDKIKKAFSGETIIIPEMEFSPNIAGFDGRVRIVRIMAYPLLNSDNSVDSVVITNEDITLQKQTEKNIEKIVRLDSIGTLAGGIAHDFNNILVGLYGNISLARTKLGTNDPIRNYLFDAEKSMNRATSLTKQLLTFAKGGDPIKKNISLTDLVKEIVTFDLVGSKIKSHFITNGDFLWPVEIDKGQIGQVFSNLTINAYQAMPNGGNLYITYENYRNIVSSISNNKIIMNKGDYIKITFCDEGQGIDNKIIDKIFDPYFTTKKNGNGLGLAVVFSVIRKHGGHLEIESKIDQGTTFTIYIPAKKDKNSLNSNKIDYNSEINESNNTINKKNDSKKGKIKKILLMDDDEIVLTVTKEMIEILGYRVETVSNGEDAIKKYKKSISENDTFDCIIMDLTIPGGMGGKETIKEILKLDKNATVVVSSGYASDPIMSDYNSYGFKGVIEKPFTIELLDNTISKVVY